jgi:EAL and modified HD-GYP domain-containing signal transduction protein
MPATRDSPAPLPQVAIARQPIFDRRLDVVGYELLFRDPPATVADVVDHAAATTNVILNALTEIGLDRVVGQNTAWINVSREFLLSGMATTMPAGRVALEILEDQTIDAQLIDAVRELTERGYRFALDDFTFTADSLALLDLVEVVKLDLLALGRDGLAAEFERLSPHGVKLLADPSRGSSTASRSSCLTGASMPTERRSCGWSPPCRTPICN